MHLWLCDDIVIFCIVQFWKCYNCQLLWYTKIMPLNPIPNSKPWEWSVKEIWDLVQAKFNKQACWFQVKVAMALYAGKDVVACAPTGARKTLSFWIPLLMAIEDGHVDKMMVVVTLLNLLGKQNVNSLANVGISAIAIDRTNAGVNTFKVHHIYNLYKKYQLYKLDRI